MSFINSFAMDLLVPFRRLFSRGRLAETSEAASTLHDLHIYEQMIQASSSSMVLVDALAPDMPIVFVNAAFERSTGYTRSEVMGLNCRFLHGADNQQPDLLVLRQALKQQQPCLATVRNYRKDGSMFWNELRISPVRNTEGKVTHFIGVQNDVTARKAEEVALAQSEARYRQMFNNNRAMKLLIDPDTGQIVDANEAAVVFYGYSLDVLKTMQIQQINTQPPDVIATYMQLANNQEQHLFEFQHRLASGELRDVDVFSSPIETAERRLLYSIVVDVTGKREAESQRQKLIHYLRVLNRTATELMELEDEESVYDYMGEHMLELIDKQYIELIDAFVHQSSIALQRAEAMQSLRESEARYRALFEQSNDAVFIIDLTGTHIQVNQRAEYMLGYAPQEMVGLTYRDLVIEQEHHQSEKMLQRVLSGERVPLYERTFRRKDGTWLLCEVNVEVVRDKNGRPLHIQSIVRDISERKQMEQALKSKYEELDRFFTVALDLLCIADTDGNFLKVNRAWERLLGYTTEELEAHQFLNFVHPDDIDATLVAMAQLERQEEVTNFTNRYLAKDGTYHFIEWRSRPYGKIIYAAARDITERQQMEDAMRASEERLRTIVDTIPLMIGFFDPRGQFEFVNQHWREKLGWSAEELAAYNDPLALFYPDPEYREQALAYMLAAPPGWRDFKTLTKEGDTLITSWANVRLSDGRSIGIGQDVTELRQAEQQQIELLLERERTKIITTFIHTAAHEFRTPLTRISFGAHSMARATDPDKRFYKAEEIETQVKRMTRLVDMLLTIVKIESLAKLDRAPVDIQALLEGLCKEMHKQHGTAPHLMCEIKPNLPLVSADADYLADALEELLDNAYRFTPPDGAIRLAAGTTNGHVWIEVNDTGPGIPKEALPHIFETFWRQDTAHSTPGFGLGLTIAHRIIDMHGGKITVESQPNEGTRFFITLPVMRK
ncbi:MAG: hypothetical protein OHK0046_27880 [Anaerolineae bacterium]